MTMVTSTSCIIHAFTGLNLSQSIRKVIFGINVLILSLLHLLQDLISRNGLEHIENTHQTVGSLLTRLVPLTCKIKYNTLVIAFFRMLVKEAGK